MFKGFHTNLSFRFNKLFGKGELYFQKEFGFTFLPPLQQQQQ